MKEQALELIKSKKYFTLQERELIKKTLPTYEVLYLDYIGNDMWMNNSI